VDWVREFYSTTGVWWGAAEARITGRDIRRVGHLLEHAGTAPLRVLELGSGYGTTAIATAQAGHAVTAVEISDRADRTEGIAASTAPGTLRVVKADFYDVSLPDRFDAVCYWNGFGIGSDRDQRRLLRRIAGEWLRSGGVALVDVSNPFVWAGWNGEQEHRMPDPAAGYAYELHERTSFDPVGCTAIDTWWAAAAPERPISQSIRCYTPADLVLLLEGTGMVLTAIAVGGQVFPPSPRPGLAELLHDHHEYLAVLRHAPAP
jgi:SAM-dependent methyltransferase